MKNIRLLLALTICLAFAHQAWAIVNIDRQFSDNMVLPMEKESRIFGTCGPKDVVSLGFRGELYRATCNREGIWEVNLKNGSAGGPFEITIYGANPLVISNVQVGIVVIVFGNDSTITAKSNLKFTPEEERKISFLYPSSNYSGLPVPYAIANKGWQKPDYAKQLIFPGQLAKNLYAKYKLPIGIIVVFEEGAKADAYMPNSALKEYAPDPESWYALDELKLEGADYENYRRNELNQNYRSWIKEQLKQGKKGFATPKSFLDGNENFLQWDSINHPNMNVANYKQLKNGVYYLHRFLKLPTALTGNDSVIAYIGRVYDQDSVWIDGKFMGASAESGKLRRYTIPEKELKKTNIVRLLIKVTSFDKYIGGIRIAEDSCILRYGQYRLEFTQLAGNWTYTQTLSFDTLATPSVKLKADRPSLLYNAQVYPFRSYGAHSIVYAISDNQGNDWKILKGVSAALKADFPDAQVTTWHHKQEGTSAQKELYAQPKDYWPLLTYDLPAIHPIVIANRIVGNEVLKITPDTKPQFPEIVKCKIKGEKCMLTLSEPLFVISKKSPYVFVITNTEGTSMETSDFELKGNKLELHVPKGWKLSYLSYQVENSGIGSYLVNSKGLPLAPFVFNNTSIK